MKAINNKRVGPNGWSHSTRNAHDLSSMILILNSRAPLGRVTLPSHYLFFIYLVLESSVAFGRTYTDLWSTAPSPPPPLCELMYAVGELPTSHTEGLPSAACFKGLCNNAGDDSPIVDGGLERKEVAVGCFGGVAGWPPNAMLSMSSS